MAQRKLYRDKFATFEEYIAQRHGLSRQHAYRLIDAAEVVEELSPIGDKIPETESQCRELAKISPKDRPAVWTEVTQESEATGQKVTAKMIRTAAAPRRKSGGEKAVDTVGDTELPPGVSRGVGIRWGNEAIDCLKKIPQDDGLRARGFQIVSDWIRHNKTPKQ